MLLPGYLGGLGAGADAVWRQADLRLAITPYMLPGELAISDEIDASRASLRLRGELDMLTAPELESAVERLSRNGAREVMLDLSQLGFLDSSGFRAILACKAMCEERGCTFLMTRGPERVQKVFDVSGVLKRLPFV